MKTEKYITAIAGLFVVLSITLSFLHSVYWLLFALFIGLNLFQYSFTGFCPITILLNKLGIGE